MNVTDAKVRVSNKKSEDRILGYADIILENSFVVHGLKIIEGENGIFVAMPSRRVKSGEFKDIIHPTCPVLRKNITDYVVDKYNKIKIQN